MMLESWEDSWLQTRNNKSRVIKKKIAVVAWETSSRESRMEEVLLAKLHSRIKHGYFIEEPTIM